MMWGIVSSRKRSNSHHSLYVLNGSYGTKENPIEQLTDILELEANFSFVDGDGTVPLESSMVCSVLINRRGLLPPTEMYLKQVVCVQVQVLGFT